MSKLRIGVIGCGSIAKYRHIPEYAAHPAVEIVALCDIVAERVQAIAKEYGADAYTDYKDLIRRDDIDAVSVCTPNYLHAPLSIEAAKAGKHVLCEKPMATSQEEAEEMIEAAEANKVFLMIGHNQRFVPSHQKAKSLIESQELGKVVSFRTVFGHGGPEGWSADGGDSWFFRKKEAFVGAMGDLGVHKADLIRFLLGEEIVEAAAFVSTLTKHGADVDDNATCILRSESGVIGTMVASWSYVPKEDNSTIIYCEKGIIRLEDHPHYALIVQYENGQTVNYELGKIQSNDEGGQSDSGVIRSFVKSVLNGEKPAISGEEGYASLKVVLACLESNTTKTFIKV